MRSIGNMKHVNDLFSMNFHKMHIQLYVCWNTDKQCISVLRPIVVFCFMLVGIRWGYLFKHVMVEKLKKN